VRAGPQSPVARRPCGACKSRPGDVLTPVDDGEARLCWVCAHQVADHGIALLDAPAARCSCDPADIEPVDPAGSATAASFQGALDAHLPHLRGVALRLTRNSADAEDVLQDALARAFRGWPRFVERYPGAARSWLATVVRRTFVNEYHRRARVMTRDRAAVAETRASSGPEAWADYLDAQAALARLSADHRTVLELTAEGMTCPEIAERLAIPVGTVMTRVFRARRRMAEMLQISTDTAERGEA
jgi:RNA polymerase sigma-70 factor (ECF subfamily)